jgi:hypothetical protein
MKRKPLLVGTVAVFLAAFAICCDRLAELARRDRDPLASALCAFALGVSLYALAWWLIMWTRQIWRDVTSGRDPAER